MSSWPNRGRSGAMGTLVKDFSDRLPRRGKTRQLLWRTSVKTAIVDGGE